MVLLLVCALLSVSVPVHAARSEADLFAEAESRYLGGTYEAAIEAYDAFTETYPRSSLVPDAHYRRAVALLRLERWQEASDALRDVETRWRATRWIGYVPALAGHRALPPRLLVARAREPRPVPRRPPDPDLTPQALLHRALCLAALEDPSGGGVGAREAAR